jgi:hypothetical protein
MDKNWPGSTETSHVSFIIVKHISIIGIYDNTINTFVYQSRLLVLIFPGIAEQIVGCRINLCEKYKENYVRIYTILQHGRLFILMTVTAVSIILGLNMSLYRQLIISLQYNLNTFRIALWSFTDRGRGVHPLYLGAIQSPLKSTYTVSYINY